MKEYQRNTKIISFVTIALLGAIGIHYYMDTRQPPPELHIPSYGDWGTAYDEHTPVISAPPAATAATTDSHPPARISADLLHRYNTGLDMRAFVRHALQHPHQGGYFYAVKVLQQCRGISLAPPTDVSRRYSPGEDSRKVRQVTDAAERLRERCAGFDAEDVAEGRTRGLWQAGRMRDPLIRASVDFSEAFSRDLQPPFNTAARTQALHNILKTGDPLLFDDMNLRLALHVVDGKKGFMLGGEFHDLHSEVDVGAAIYLLPCATGLACDDREFDVLTRCGHGGDCDANRFRHIENMVENIPGGYEKVMAAYEAMREAVGNRDARYFAQN